uniref:Mlo2 n=1 Tax=Arundo donax TaxID=35708 RepID=A0A0A9ES08_ARUDO
MEDSQEEHEDMQLVQCIG